MNKTAKFYDGKSSISFSVQIDPDIHGIFVKGLGSKISEYYQYSDLKIIELPVNSLPGVIASIANSDVRLLIEDPSLFSMIQSKIKMKSSKFSSLWISGMLLAMTTFICLILLYKLPYNYSHLIAEAIPQSWEDKFGEYGAKVLTTDYVTCTNDLGQKALEKLVRDLVNAGEVPVPVTIKVFDDDSTNNAFAMSGNQIFVFSGLIKNSDDYDELAGVLAHEIGHVLKRHPTERMIHGLGLSFLIKMISGGIGQLDSLLTTSSLFLTLHYSRAHETEADDVAIQILTKTGIGTKGFLTFFDKLEAEQTEKLKKFHKASKKLEGFLSTHPLTEDRINHIKNQFVKQSFPRKRILTKVEWAQIKAMCQTKISS